MCCKVILVNFIFKLDELYNSIYSREVILLSKQYPCIEILLQFDTCFRDKKLRLSVCACQVCSVVCKEAI